MQEHVVDVPVLRSLENMGVLCLVNFLVKILLTIEVSVEMH